MDAALTSKKNPPTDELVSGFEGDFPMTAGPMAIAAATGSREERTKIISGGLLALAYRLIAVNVRAQLVTADACGLLKEENAIQRNRFPLKHGTLADAKLASDLQPAIAVVHQDLF